MRLIAGRAGGLPLLSPKHNARPTTGRAREAIFSKLTNRLPGAAVADLFAGSGALGLEALSRGAALAVFVDNHRGACDVIRRNIETTGFAAESTICQTDVMTWLRLAAGPFDLIFADPPYRTSPADPDRAAALLAAPELPALIASDGLFVLETLATRDTMLIPSPWRLRDQRTYGSSLISYLQPRPQTP
jgi:16S rRNA (guanine966-N2)-methyltransferase